MWQSLLFIIIISTVFPLRAQDLTAEARRIIDTLSSKTMSGRGYVNNGDRKAADYIVSYLKHISRIPDSNIVRQQVPFSINTFPGAMLLEADKQTLLPGQDFIVKAFSSSLKGKYRIKPVNLKQLWQSDSTKISLRCGKREVLCIRASDWPASIERRKTEWLLEHKRFGASALIEIQSKKLTMDASQEQLPLTWIELLADTQAPIPHSINVNIENVFVPEYRSQNILGIVKGTTVPDSFLVFTAHYDHLGTLGTNTYFPGANDNASGVSMLLNLSKTIAQQPLKYSTAFIFFTGEEAGLIGSHYFTQHPIIPLNKIRFLVNIDLAGTGDDGIKVVNGAVDTLHFNKLKQLNDLEQLVKSVQPRGKAANSDHYFFTQAGVPSFFIYTLGGISAYHDIFDKAETLPLSDYNDYYRLLLLYMKSF
ncbi:MAG: M28 family metallopeptidase [Bacteroidota bacterium]|jgi:hypothetical protein